MTKAIPSNIYPSIFYDDAPAAIEWLCRAFGFTKRLVVPGPGGTVRHSELSLGPGVIMVGSARIDAGRISPRGLSGLHQALCVRVDNPDAHLARAKAAGALITQELKDEEYGSRGYMAKDPEGHEWYFGTYLPGEHWGESPKRS
ncbi:MAG: VOC family protein [Acidobacteria bacterium]|nr:VOC family protein [Acidobacteriota bacterium]